MNSDIALIAAARELSATDTVIAAFCARFGDNVDKQELYWTAENRRDEVLELLATVPATSPAGMVAKAKALQATDTEHSRFALAIAKSLADDVTRHFGHAA